MTDKFKSQIDSELSSIKPDDEFFKRIISQAQERKRFDLGRVELPEVKAFFSLIKSIDFKGFTNNIKAFFQKDKRPILKISAAAAAVMLVVFFIAPSGRALVGSVKKVFAPRKETIIIEGVSEQADLSASVTTPTDAADIGYSIYYDTNVFKSEKTEDEERVCALENSDAYLTVIHLDNTAFDDYIAKHKAETDADIIEENLELDIIPTNTGYSTSTGNHFDDFLTTTYAIDDGNGGCFVMMYTYTVEASEGFGVRFAQIACSFELLIS